MQDTWVQSLGWKIPWRKKWKPIPVFLPGKSHAQRSLAGYSSWGCKELDMAEQLITAQSYIIYKPYELGICYYIYVVVVVQAVCDSLQPHGL